MSMVQFEGTMRMVIDVLTALIGGAHSRLWPLYLPSMLLIAYLVYRKEQRSEGFVKWLFPRSMYFHKSHMIDVQLFVLNRAISLFGVFQKLAISTSTTSLILIFFGSDVPSRDSLSPWVIAAVILLASDFSTYWIHRIHHEHPALWPFHAVHHSAEVMTPMTVYRKHPIYDLFSACVRGLILGTVQGFLLLLFVSQINMTLLVGVNVFYFSFNAAAANLRHSHVWVSFGVVLEHIFISPSQHQVHHSIEQKHYNKNYGEVLAIWDWMFGTLYVPKKREELSFGLGDAKGNPVAQMHTTLRVALIVPIRQSWAVIRKRNALSKQPKSGSDT
jgi:sterol desaturase/sphingolipid hydroxylase (fatty acid hydroxylase superfamily)